MAGAGDEDTVDLRRSKALGWLSQPAGALDLLMRHTDDPDPTNDAEPEPAEATAPEPRPSAGDASDGDDEVPDDVDPEQAAHGLRLTAPARFDAAKARPKVVLHFHLSDTTLRAGTDGTCTGAGMVRPEHGGPITDDQVRPSSPAVVALAPRAGRAKSTAACEHGPCAPAIQCCYLAVVNITGR